MALATYQNSKLDEQLLKLQACKSEMSKLFDDLDNMIESDVVYLN